MTEARPLAATMEWDGEQQFTGFAGKHELGLDGNGTSAPTPVQALALSLMGCMSIDLLHILTKGRHPVKSLKTTLHADRAPEPPKRFTRIRMEFELTGEMEPEHVERAVDLSREKYCSVWATFRQDIELIVSFTISRS
jgi:putative redox protein